MTKFNILYFAFVSDHFGGVEQKIIGQFDALNNINNNTHLYFVSSSVPNEKLKSEIKARDKVQSLVNTMVNNAFSRRKEKFEFITNELKKFSPLDTVIYFRYPNADFLFLDFLKKNSEYKIVTEHQEFENTFLKYKFNGNYLRNILELFYGKKVRMYINGFVGVTSEIIDFQFRILGNSNVKSLYLGNGISVDKYKLRKPIENNKTKLNILFVGAGYKTHGLHRLLFSLKKHISLARPKENIQIFIVGDSNEMIYNKNIVRRLNLQDIVTFKGFLQGEELDALYDWATLGTGSLAIGRKGLKYTSELKAREYLSRGLPFFWSTIDEDIQESTGFILFLEEDVPLNFQRILEFNRGINQNEIATKMRAFANANLDFSVKMNKLNKFLYEILRS